MRRFNLIFIPILFLLICIQPVLADVVPQYLPAGRTYDQEEEYIQRNGNLTYIRLYHRDNVSLPPEEGGASCQNGCYEYVTRIYDGGSVSGNFTNLKTFSVQLATSGSRSTGTATVRACGQTVLTVNMYLPGAGVPGFNNYPSPAWQVPTGEDCTWSITASGGYVDFRAVTTTYRSNPLPLVDLKVNGEDGEVSLPAHQSFDLSWNSQYADQCTASGAWAGQKAISGNESIQDSTAGDYTYRLTCENAYGSRSDEVIVHVLDAPIVEISAPAQVLAPGNYEVSWVSEHASECTGSEGFTGLSGLQNNLNEVDMPAGAYSYGVTCSNVLGVSTNASATVMVMAPLEGNITVQYPRLLLYGPTLNLPAQTVSGTVMGGLPPYTVVVVLRTPSGMESQFDREGSAWTLTPADAGDPYLGTIEQGTWSAWALITDDGGSVFQTEAVYWEVAWVPVHALP